MQEDCTLTTDIVIKTKKLIDTQNIEIKLSKFNLTIKHENNKNSYIPIKIQLQPIITNPMELTKLNSSLDEINKEVETSIDNSKGPSIIGLA